MHILLAALFCFAILTLWVPALWPVTVFQVGVLALAGVSLGRMTKRPPPFVWPLVPLSIAVLWGVLQWLTGRTAYAFDTKNAIVHWATFLAVFLVGLTVFQDALVRRWFRSAMIWFGFLISILATLQTFTSNGRVFWIFPTQYTEFLMGPIVSRNHYAVFIEVVLPMALYEALSRERGAILYSGMAAAMYASVIASASRTGTLLATAEVLVVVGLMWLGGRATRRVTGTSLLGIAVLFALMVAVAGPETVWARFMAPYPMAWRREFAISTLHMIRAHPWFGLGLGTWATVYPGYAVVDFGVFVNQAHSDWLQWAAEGGIPFGIAIVTLFAWSLHRAFRSVWGLGVIAVFLHAMVDYPFSRPALGCWAIVVLAMLAAPRDDTKVEAQILR